MSDRLAKIKANYESRGPANQKCLADVAWLVAELETARVRISELEQGMAEQVQQTSRYREALKEMCEDVTDHLEFPKQLVRAVSRAQRALTEGKQ